MARRISASDASDGRDRRTGGTGRLSAQQRGALRRKGGHLEGERHREVDVVDHQRRVKQRSRDDGQVVTGRVVEVPATVGVRWQNLVFEWVSAVRSVRLPEIALAVATDADVDAVDGRCRPQLLW